MVAVSKPRVLQIVKNFMDRDILPPVLPPDPKKADQPPRRRPPRRRKKDSDDEDSDDGGDFDPSLPPPRRRATGLNRDQLGAFILLPIIVIGGSKLSFWVCIKLLEMACIGLDLTCKPKGY